MPKIKPRGHGAAPGALRATQRPGGRKDEQMMEPCWGTSMQDRRGPRVGMDTTNPQGRHCRYGCTWGTHTSQVGRKGRLGPTVPLGNEAVLVGLQERLRGAGRATTHLGAPHQAT